MVIPGQELICMFFCSEIYQDAQTESIILLKAVPKQNDILPTVSAGRKWTQRIWFYRLRQYLDMVVL